MANPASMAMNVSLAIVSMKNALAQAAPKFYPVFVSTVTCGFTRNDVFVSGFKFSPYSWK